MRTLIALWACSLLLVGPRARAQDGGASPPAAGGTLRTPPEGFVDLVKTVPGLRLHIGYHTSQNFTGAPLPGYGAEGAWLLEPAAQALAKVAQDLAARHLGLLVYDAYRPARASQAMVAWARRTGHADLLGPYIAPKSGHNHGNTVDLTVVDLTTGVPLEMGTPWDTFAEGSHTANATGQALENRLLLRKAMEARGFRPYNAEWWHFTFPMKKTRPRDVPYGSLEPDEGHWQPAPSSPPTRSSTP